MKELLVNGKRRRVVSFTQKVSSVDSEGNTTVFRIDRGKYLDREINRKRQLLGQETTREVIKYYKITSQRMIEINKSEYDKFALLSFPVKEIKEIK